MTSFEIKTPKDFLTKLCEERADFEAAHCLSSRHAINAIMTAYHMHEWVWGSFAKRRYDLHQQWGLLPHPSKDKFCEWLFVQCPALRIAEGITNGTKHFSLSNVSTGMHAGAFQRNAFQPDAFDVSRLWIEREDEKQDAEDFVQELVQFWKDFFIRYEI